jgi:hypothetical protein
VTVSSEFEQQFRIVQDALKGNSETDRQIARLAITKYAEFTSIVGVLRESHVQDS